MSDQIFDKLISSGVNFALFRLAKEKSIHLIQQDTSPDLLFDELSSVNVDDGFVIAPFHPDGKNKVIVIPADICLSGEQAIEQHLSTLPKAKLRQRSSRTNGLDAHSGTFEHYQQAFQKFHARVSDQTLEKLVLSRTLDLTLPSGFSAGEIFKKACQKYPDNFIYLAHHPTCGTWLGCSPEIIVAGAGDAWRTDALAGTQPLRGELKEVVWDDKNLREQKIVVDYMQEQLAKLAIPSLVQPTQTIRSGGVVHLRSEVQFKQEDTSQIFKVLSFLHPSPAVCGMPKKEAFDFILANEGYNREYYSGFVGSLAFNGRTDLFVNLRCMQIFDYSLRLYAGGGILPSSELHSEWEETEHKLQTIRSLLEP